MADPAGIAIGLGALLLAFKGVVDTVNLFDLILAADNGSKFIALKYYIERHRFNVWGDEFKPHDEKNSPLSTQSRITKMLIAGILAEIRATHESAEKYVPRYKMNDSAFSKAISGQGALGSGLGTRSIDDGVAPRNQMSSRHRFSWAAKDKAKFEELIMRLKALNEDLYAAVPSDNSQALANALSSYLLPKLQDQVSLLALQQIDGHCDPLLVLSARIKQLNNAPESETAQQAKWLEYGGEFKPDGGLPTSTESSGREFGYCDQDGSLGKPSWIEWKVVQNNLSLEHANMISNRIEALAVLLNAATAPDFRIPPCVGILEHGGRKTATLGRPRKLGFVFTAPDIVGSNSTPPSTLKELLKDGDAPLLSDRFMLAYKLASALSLFHASKWLHKGLRSDNILIFYAERDVDNASEKSSNKEPDPIISEPFICGFEYSRPEAQESIDVVTTGNVELDYYYHPDVAIHGFSKLRDIYSLGILLFEVARWRTLGDSIAEDLGKNLNDMDIRQIQTFLLESVPELGSIVGPSYRDAVKDCLTGDFNVAADDDGTSLARGFFAKVLKRLNHCRA